MSAPPPSATAATPPPATGLPTARGLREAAVALAMAALVGIGATPIDAATPIGPFAPAVGFALAVLLRLGPGRAAALALGAWLAFGAVGGVGWPVAAALAAGTALSALLGAFWLSRADFSFRLRGSRDIWLLTGTVLCGALVLDAANGAVWLMLAGRLPLAELVDAWLAWWLADVVGVLLVGVGVLAFDANAWRAAWRAPQGIGNAVLMLAAVLAAGVGMAAAVGGRLVWLPALALPLLALTWTVLRAGIVLGTCWVAAASVYAALAIGRGWTPLAQVAVIASPAAVWAYLLAAQALALIVHLLAGRARAGAQRAEVALAAADIGVAEWNLAGGNGYTSPRWRQLHGDPDGTRTATPASWLRQVHDDERADLRAALDALDRPGGGSLWRQARLRVGEAWPWYELRVVVVERTAGGAPTRLVATVSDVQERRSAQDRERLSSSLFRNLHEGLVIVDDELRILDVNPTYSRITGIAREELLGTVPSLLASNSTDAITRAQQNAIWAGLRTQGHWSGEVVERRRNGDPCALHVSVFTVHDPDGAVRYRVMMLSDITEQRLQRERLERQAHYDELTRLPNRSRLMQLLTDAMVAADREGHLLTVCSIDLDRFKSVNEREGRAAGDQLLVELAARLRSALRAHASWSDIAARPGGDEFVLLMRADTVDEARLAVERVLRVIAAPYALAPGAAPTAITASVGATVYPIDRSDADTLLRHADQAMFGAKQAGRDRYLFFDPEHSRRAEERVLALGRVQEAIDRQEFSLHYQPKVDLRRGAVLGFEALLRWNHPEHGLIAPAQFLPLIEHTGLSARVGDWVLAQALAQLEQWRALGFDFSVSVNVSARHLQEPDFVQRLAELLARHPTLGAKLELEILETAALADIGYTSNLLEQCTALGVRCALDDFGTGYSTLTYLKRLPVQVLKIDRSFVHNMLGDAQDRAIVEGVVSLARTFGCVAVAEGVESPAQARMLLDLGCEVGQGSGIAAPMPAAEVARWVSGWRGLFAISPAPGVASTQAPPRAR